MEVIKIRQKEFCRLTNLTRKALLIYEEKKLLIPYYIDPNNGYRYYGENEINRGSLLSFLSNFGFSLDDIRLLLDKQSTIPELSEKNRLEKKLTSALIKANHCLKALKINQKEIPFLETQPLLKTYPNNMVLSLESSGTISEIKVNILRVTQYMIKHALYMSDPLFIIYYANCRPPHYHYKICFPVNIYFCVDHPDIRWERLTGDKAVTTRHIGSYDSLYLAYKRLHYTCHEKQWSCSGVYIETYIIGGDTRLCDSSSFITEVAAVLL